MNLPNKLTVARLILVLVFAFFAFPLPGWMPAIHETVRAGIALAVYAIASLTDALDGHLARKNGQITDFGKFLDPIADKLLVTAALLALVPRNRMYLWAALIILTREFVVSGVRMLAASEGVVIAAGTMGKLKMIVQTVALVTLLTACIFTGKVGRILTWIGDIEMIAAVVLTIWSGLEYVIGNRKLFLRSK